MSCWKSFIVNKGLLIAVAFLVGCSPKTEIVRITPPITFVTPLEEPVPPAPGTNATVEDIILYGLECQSMLKQCNIDRRILRRFFYED
jgi:hypothetical protein